MVSKSKALRPSNSWFDIFRHISEHCAFLRDKIRVIDKHGVFTSTTVGRAFYVEFMGYDSKPPALKIIDDEDTPLTGKNIKKTSLITVPFGENLWYEPIPFEMLKTYETKPQVIVNVNDMPAVCHNLTCDFTYTTPVGEVTAFTYATATRVVVITGTAFPAAHADIQVIKFALTECTIDKAKYS